MIVALGDVVYLVGSWLVADVAYPGVSFEDDAPPCVPVAGEPVFSGFGFVCPAVALVGLTSAHVDRVFPAVRFKAGGRGYRHQLPRVYPLRMSEVQTAPAGWYDDPAAPGIMRWWNGSDWTEHRSPKYAAPGVVINQRRPYKTSHGFHLLMSIFTLGLWLPVWLVVGIYNAARA